jgi:DNA-binding IclR family transcriptional regulator
MRRKCRRRALLAAQVRRRGYATGDRECQRTTRTLAVPILVNAAPVASLNIMVVPSAMNMEQLVKACCRR